MASKLETPTIVPLDTQESKLFHFFQVYMLLIIYIVLILVIIITLNKWEIFYFLQNWYFAKDTWMLSFCHCHAQSSSPCTLCLARFFLYSLMSIDFPPSPPKLLVVSYSQVVHWNSIKVSYSYDFVHMVFLVSSFPPFCWTIFWSWFYIDSL